MTYNGPRVAVIGAGFGGIAVAVYLKRAGIDTFTVFERAEGPGGTWWHNTYPGAQVDTVSSLYSFSFRRGKWTQSHVDQAELQEYLEDTIRDFDLKDHIRYGMSVEKLVWDDDGHFYTVEFGDGTTEQFDVVISAVGIFNKPNIPDWPGKDKFRGAFFHSGEWDHSCDLNGKRVAVVGTGSTSAQIVPAIAPIVDQLYVFQREPGWMFPKPVEKYSPEEQEELYKPWGYRKRRYQAYLGYERPFKRGNINHAGSKPNQEMEAGARAHIDSVFADRPDLKEMVTPKHSAMGKRPMFSSDFYPALLRDNVELVPKAVTALTETGIVDADGVERPVDVVVAATGWAPANFLSSLTVIGRNGRDLHDQWKDGAEAFLGVTVPNFPNLYIIYGPNTNSPIILGGHEHTAKFAVNDIVRMRKTGITAIEVRESVADAYNRRVQQACQKTVWVQSNNYYSTGDKVVTQWPWSPARLAAALKLSRRFASTTRRRAAKG